jgi:hypothetical protein
MDEHIILPQTPLPKAPALRRIPSQTPLSFPAPPVPSPPTASGGGGCGHHHHHHRPAFLKYLLLALAAGLAGAALLSLYQRNVARTAPARAVPSGGYDSSSDGEGYDSDGGAPPSSPPPSRKHRRRSSSSSAPPPPAGSGRRWTPIAKLT